MTTLRRSTVHGTGRAVKGDHAYALWVGPGEQGYAMPMVREAGAWRVTQIAPPSYPTGSAP
ncbi:MAG TPA: hypothetical protein VFN85_06215 [Solirubrobacterales bacterium]|nr:hypothetical protein [Solirubrobacterales bacterium]